LSYALHAMAQHGVEQSTNTMSNQCHAAPSAVHQGRGFARDAGLVRQASLRKAMTGPIVVLLLHSHMGQVLYNSVAKPLDVTLKVLRGQCW